MRAPVINQPTARAPEPQLSDDESTDDRLIHRFRFADIERSLASGAVITALCGHRKRLSSPHRYNLPLCPPCMNLVDLAESLEDGL